MLIKAIISEKALKEARNKRYTFVVAVKATKTQIKKWVEKMFGVAVQRVWTTIMPGKVKRRGKKGIMHQAPDWKKAVVAIDPKQKIDLFDAVETKESK
ncbi:MAG: 50S ribosomal protein L23 [Patescibacteria group bacterium]